MSYNLVELQKEGYVKEFETGFPTVDQGYPLLEGAVANTRTTGITAKGENNVYVPNQVGTVYMFGQYWIQFMRNGVVKYMGRDGAVDRFDKMGKFSRVGKGRGWNSLGGNTYPIPTGNTGYDSNVGLFDSPQWFRAVNSNPVQMGW